MDRVTLGSTNINVNKNWRATFAADAAIVCLARKESRLITVRGLQEGFREHGYAKY